MPANETDGAAILAQAMEMDIDAVFLGTEAWDTESFMEKAGDAASLAVFSTVYDAETSVNSTTELFLDAYREKYGEDAVPEPEVALGFDAYMIADYGARQDRNSAGRRSFKAQLAVYGPVPGSVGKYYTR